MATLWYVRRNEQIKGPFKVDVVARFIARSQIRDTDTLSRDRKDWQTLDSARPLFAEALAKISAETGESTAEVTAAASKRGMAGQADPTHATSSTVGPPSDARAERPRAASAPDIAVPSRSSPEPTEPRSGSRTRAHERIHGAHPDRPRRSVPPQAFERLKQAGALGSVMALIVVAGVAFLPSPDAITADCSAPATPGVNWSNCQLNGRDLGRATLERATLRSARMSETRLLGASLGGADLAYVELDRATLAYADLSAASMVGANLRDADLSYARLNGADLSHADLTGANLGGADLSGATFDNAIWIDRRICYEGSTGGCRVPLVSGDAGSRQ